MASSNRIAEMTKKVEELNQLRLDMSTLKGCLMVDPSFSRIEEFGINDKPFKGYVSNSIRKIDEVNAVPENTRNNILNAPFGYLKDLIPELANKKNKNAIIQLSPSIDGLFATSTAGAIDLKSLNKTHPFIRFISKLNEDFKTMQ